MVQERLVSENSLEDSPPPDESGLKLRVILKFLSLWIMSLLMLVAIALLSNIEWARRHIENALCQTFNRKVELGKLSWSIGLHGLAIDSDHLEMKGKKGEPFVSAGPSEIGIALLPLLQKRLVVKHLEFEEPEVWAFRLSDKEWNFSDLITEGPEIRMLQIERGQLHLRNKAPAKSRTSIQGPVQASGQAVGAIEKLNPLQISSDWQSYDLKDLKLSLTFPNKMRSWPLFLSFKVPVKDGKGKSYESSLRLSATGKGPFDEWKKNNYSVDLQVQDFDPSRFRPLFASLPQLSGICNLKFKGEGVFEKGFEAASSCSVKNLALAAWQHKELEIADAEGSAMLVLAPGFIKWKDLKFRLESFQLDSDGLLSDWQKGDCSYQARVGGQLSDLKGFFNKVVSRFLPEQEEPGKKITSSKLEKIEKAERTGKLGGSATIELHLSGNKNDQSVSTNIKADGIALAQLVDDDMSRSLLETFKLDPGAPIKGELSIDPGKKLLLKQLEIPLEDSKVVISGFVDQKSKETELDFRAENLSFDTFKKRLGSDNQIIKAICGSSARSKPYALSGMLDLTGKYRSDGVKQDVSIDSTLKGLKMTRQDANAASCRAIKGRVIYKDQKVEVRQLTGITAATSADSSPGDFVINGYFYPSGASGCELDLKAHSVSMVHLKDWLNRFGINIKEVGLEKISGDMQELKAHMSMKNSQLNTSFNINPSDLQVSLGTGAAQQFRLSSGRVSYENGELIASDLGLSSRGGHLILSGIMQGSLDDLKFSSGKIKTDGFELADLSHFLKASLKPQLPVKNAASEVAAIKSQAAALPDILVPANPATLHGKIYGEIFLKANSQTPVTGVLGFHNAGGKFGKSAVSVEKLTGLAVISKDQVVLQETTGQIGKSTFNLDGILSNYSGPAFNWQGQLRGQFYPSEVDSLMYYLGHGIALGSQSEEALALRVSGSGDQKSASLKFRGRATSTYGISLKTAFGTFRQPAKRPLTFNGGLKLDSDLSELALSNFQLSSDNELLQAAGSFRWANETAEKPASLSFSLNTPKPIKSATLMEIISQSPATETVLGSGSSHLNLKVEGPVNDLILSGSIVLDHNSIPQMNVDNLSGKLELPGWRLNRTPSASEPIHSVAKLQLKSMSFGGIALHDAHANLSLADTNKVIFKDFQASMSHGKLSIKGFYNRDTQAYHADVDASKLVVDELVKDLIDHSGGVTGLADLHLTLDNPGGAYPLRSLKGTGKFNVYQGTVASFGKLQEKLNEANLLQQGLFGFNVNNLLQAMMPVKSGQFNEVSGNLKIANGNISFDQVRFEGNNLRMRAAGEFDFLMHKMEVAVAGDIPRVSSSLIPGALGEMSRKVTLQRMFRIVTFKKLKDLPALPLLGDIANDDPRAFVFKVETSTEEPKLITQAVEKSFRWLPNKPFASAHPVPGM